MKTQLHILAAVLQQHAAKLALRAIIALERSATDCLESGPAACAAVMKSAASACVTHYRFLLLLSGSQTQHCTRLLLFTSMRVADDALPQL
jgi:hypothetical protein